MDKINTQKFNLGVNKSDTSKGEDVLGSLFSIPVNIDEKKVNEFVVNPSIEKILSLKKISKNLGKLEIMYKDFFSRIPENQANNSIFKNDEVFDFFVNENFKITSNSYFNIKSDIDIGKVDPNYLFKVLTKMDHKNSDALFVSCTALPILSILDKLEKKIKKIVLSSNQTLIWDTLDKIGENNSIKGFGKLFNSN